MEATQIGLTLGIVAALAGSAAARPDYSYSGPPVEIPDGTGTATPGIPASVAITVAGAQAITRLSCSIYIAHTFQGDLVVTLTHVETGRSVTLIDRPYVPQTPLGFPASDYGTAAVLMQLDDGAAAVYDAPTVAPPGISGVSGGWRPQGPLSAFNGESSAGTWRLTATDYAGGDTGAMVAYRLTVNPVAPCYPNCDASTAAPLLNVNDFQCFLNEFASAGTYANCDASTSFPILNVNDFQCFINAFATGCTG